MPYSYVPAYADQKTGTFTVEIVYTGFSGSKFPDSKSVYVYSKFSTVIDVPLVY